MLEHKNHLLHRSNSKFEFPSNLTYLTPGHICTNGNYYVIKIFHFKKIALHFIKYVFKCMIWFLDKDMMKS